MLWLQELTQRLAAHYRAADAKPGAPPPPDGGKLLVTLQEPLPLQVTRDIRCIVHITRQLGGMHAGRLETGLQPCSTNQINSLAGHTLTVA